MNRLLIVDGSNLLFQMFFGMPSRITNSEGKAIQGTLGFVGALLKIISKTEPTHIAILFDGEHGNERTKLNADYKANRVDYSQEPEEDYRSHSFLMCMLRSIIWASSIRRPQLVKQMTGLRDMFIHTVRTPK